MKRGTLSDGLVFDAVRIRLLEIGEAVFDTALPGFASLDRLRRRRNQAEY